MLTSPALRSAFRQLSLTRLVSLLPPVRTMSTSASASSPLNLSQLDQAIKDIGETVRTLKASNADPELVKSNLDQLLTLKSQRATLTGVPVAAGGGGGGKKKAQKFTLKTPKGTKDWHPTDMLLRQTIFRTITDIFELHGAVTIDTPVFELKEILSGKYGEDSKLIYDLEDQGGELCSLRYDLTVPFARFLAMNGSQYPNIKRYHIAKVYRRDQPAMSKGRMREFYQCDFDIAGVYDPMLPDAEILAIACQILEGLGIGEFTIKVNHRKLLDGLFAISGVPADKIRTISSAVDKLDKMSWEDVKKEMTVEKGLDEAVADRIGEYVKLKGSEELVDRLEKDEVLMGNKIAKEGLKDMRLLFKYLHVFGVVPKISFDLSLARGLDYYTGIIYEAVTEGSAPPVLASAATPTPPPTSKPKKAATATADADEIDESTVGVGSIAAGGRYDELVGMFSGSSGAAGKIPCVGISFGVERIFSLLAAKRGAEEEGRGKKTEAYVIALGGDLLVERMTIARELWEGGIKAEFQYKNKPKNAATQFALIDKERIPYAVIVSPDEWAEGTVRVKVQRTATGEDAQGDAKGEIVKRAELVEYLKTKLSR